MINQAAPEFIVDNYGDEEFVDRRVQAAEKRVSHAIGAKLEQTYPGHYWRVEIPHNQGIIKIMLPYFTGKVWGYIIPFDKLDPTHQTVVKAGGELLERFGLSRSSFNEAELSDALDIYGKTPPPIRNEWEIGDRPVRRVWKHLIEGMNRGQ